MAMRNGKPGLSAAVAMNAQGSSGMVLNGTPSMSMSEQLLNGGQLSGELRNLVGSILGGQTGSSISLEQLLAGSSSTRIPQTKPPASSNSFSNPPPPTTPSGSSAGWAGKKRARTFDLDDNTKRRRTTPYSARQSGEKQHNKGLRHFSQRVCEKVREKGTTTYNEVADELVKELSESERKSASSDIPIDHKNIRRRVYDALNVLMAMNIISKEKKDIKWIGLPTNSVQECQHIEEELSQTEERLQSKRSQLEDLVVQILAFKNLMRRNRDRVSTLDDPSQNSAIGLPFLIVNTSRKTTIDCSISSDKSEYVFNFDNTFELHNDIDVLKKMGLDCGLHSGSCSPEDLKNAKSMLPKAFESTLDEMARSKNLAAAISVALTPTRTSAASNAAWPSPSSLSLSSTPTVNPSPSLSSQDHQPPAGSPQHLAAVLSSLSQVRQVTPTPSSPSLALGSIQSPSGVGSSQITVPSPRAVTQLVSNALRGGKPTSVTARPLSFTTSPTPKAKLQLHSHCPTQGTMSPLVKQNVTPIAPATASPSAYSVPLQQGSPQTSKSPGPKIVTVSKLPLNANEQLNSLLQQLQQNIQHSPLLRQLSASPTAISNGSATHDQANGQTGIGLAGQPVQTSIELGQTSIGFGQTSQTSIGLTGQTSQQALLASMLPNGLNTTGV